MTGARQPGNARLSPSVTTNPVRPAPRLGVLFPFLFLLFSFMFLAPADEKERRSVLGGRPASTDRRVTFSDQVYAHQCDNLRARVRAHRPAPLSATSLSLHLSIFALTALLMFWHVHGLAAAENGADQCGRDASFCDSDMHPTLCVPPQRSDPRWPGTTVQLVSRSRPPRRF